MPCSARKTGRGRAPVRKAARKFQMSPWASMTARRAWIGVSGALSLTTRCTPIRSWGPGPTRTVKKYSATSAASGRRSIAEIWRSKAMPGTCRRVGGAAGAWAAATAGRAAAVARSRLKILRPRCVTQSLLELDTAPPQKRGMPCSLISVPPAWRKGPAAGLPDANSSGRPGRIPGDQGAYPGNVLEMIVDVEKLRPRADRAGRYDQVGGGHCASTAPQIESDGRCEVEVAVLQREAVKAPEAREQGTPLLLIGCEPDDLDEDDAIEGQSVSGDCSGHGFLDCGRASAPVILDQGRAVSDDHPSSRRRCSSARSPRSWNLSRCWRAWANRRRRTTSVSAVRIASARVSLPSASFASSSKASSIVTVIRL